MTRPAWHADDVDLARLRDGTTGSVLAASLEAHLMACRGCRQRMNELSYDEDVDLVWTRIRASVEAPRPGIVERFLARLGMSTESAQLLAAVPSLQVGWLTGVFVVVVFAGTSAGFATDLGITLFLMVAPLAPVAGVAAAFGGDVDPTHELLATTPYLKSRLLALRTAAVLASSVPVTAVVGLLLPGPAWLALAWLTPAAAGMAVTLVLARPVGVIAAATVVTVAWVGACLSAARVREPLLVVGSETQVVLLVLLAGCVIALLRNHRTLEMPWRLS
jgi:hypothetical protein